MTRGRIRVSPAAVLQIEHASAWWLEHREKAPEALAEEMERGFDLIRSFPGAGQRVSHPQHDGLRRLLLGRVRYYLYYVEADDETVDVLALWHFSRGSQPDL